MNARLPGRLIALSAGGQNKELAAQGLGVEHVEELMVRLAMKLLRKGHRLAFGGTLGDSSQPLTRYLIDAAQSWLDEASFRQTDVNKPDTWPLVNYSAWPFHRKISQEERTRMVGICQFVNVNPSGIPNAKLDAAAKKKKWDLHVQRGAADGLSKMRERSSRETDLRIVWGGKIAGAAGWMAGILEEVSYSLAYNKPVLVFGGFGGCARLLADFLADKKAPWPAKLKPTLSANPRDDDAPSITPGNDYDERFAQAKTRLTEFRSKLWTQEDVNGIPSELIRSGLREETARHVIHLAAAACKTRKVRKKK